MRISQKIACLDCVLAGKEQVRIASHFCSHKLNSDLAVGMKIVCLKVMNIFNIDGESKIALCL